MSKTAQIVIGVLVIIVLVVLAFGWHRKSASDTALPSGTDTSNAALEQDTTSIDNDLQGLDQDRATIDQGLETPSVQ